jgi:predicted Zn-dependent protease
LQPRNALAHFGAAQCLLPSGQYDEAEGYLQRALGINPEEAVIMDSMGWLRFKQGRLTEALEMLRAAYDKQSENEIAGHLAEVLWLMDHKDEARKVFNEAFKDAPEDEYLLKFQQRFPEINN